MEKLKIGFKGAYGRNHGRISSYHRERGSKKVYKIVDFHRNLVDVRGKIKFIQKDRYRSSPVAGVYYSNKYFSYMLAIDKLKIGNFIMNTYGNEKLESNQKQLGLSCPLRYVKVGEKLHNIELLPGKGGKIIRSAGTFSKIIKKYEYNALMKLSSGEFRLFLLDCMCTIGRVANIHHHEENLLKAGKVRWLGKRPIVRGRAMNPVDHPHGGRTNGGISPRTPWGALTRGIKTVKKKKICIIKKRNK